MATLQGKHFPELKSITLLREFITDKFCDPEECFPEIARLESLAINEARGAQEGVTSLNTWFHKPSKTGMVMSTLHVHSLLEKIFKSYPTLKEVKLVVGALEASMSYGFAWKMPSIDAFLSALHAGTDNLEVLELGGIAATPAAFEGFAVPKLRKVVVRYYTITKANLTRARNQQSAHETVVLKATLDSFYGVNPVLLTDEYLEPPEGFTVTPHLNAFDSRLCGFTLSAST